MNKIIKYLEKLSNRIDIAVELYKRDVRGVISYDFELSKTDKQNRVIHFDGTITSKTELKEFKQAVQTSLALRQRRVKKLHKLIE